jgi:hypothetical protein
MISISGTVRITSAPVTFTVPLIGTYKQILHDWQMPAAYWSGKPRAYTLGWNKQDNPQGAYPDTVPMNGMKPNDFAPLNAEWQYLWFDLMRRASSDNIPDNDLRRLWRTITSDGRALTDNHTWNWIGGGEPKLFADYVQGLNLKSSYGAMQQKSLTMGGNIVKVLASQGENYVIETLNVNELHPPALDQIWEKPWLVHWGTQTALDYRAYDWPWLNWNGVNYGVPFLLIGKGGMNLIPKDVCMDIANGRKFTPY